MSWLARCAAVSKSLDAAAAAAAAGENAELLISSDASVDVVETSMCHSDGDAADVAERACKAQGMT